MNRLSIDELFQRYMETGFLYPDKLARLAPFTAEIIENWRRAAASPDTLLRIVTYAGTRERTWASLATWRHTTDAWCIQHLVSRGDPLASRAVLLAELDAMIEDPEHRSSQNWFRPDNRLPSRVFGAYTDKLGPESACAHLLTAFEVPLLASVASGGLTVTEVSATNQLELSELGARVRGPVYSIAEGFENQDFELDGIDRLYRRVGLFRYRRAWLAYSSGELMGALIAYRGPLGLNYSFVENRADLLLSPACPPGSVVQVMRQLIAAASDQYRDFRPGYVPLFVDERGAPLLAAAGLLPIRRYCQAIHVRPCYARYRAHLEATFAPVVERAERQKRNREALPESRRMENR